MNVDFNLGVRWMVDREYDCIFKLMFDLFKVIVRENLVMGGGGVVVMVVVIVNFVDLEDKEVFNFYILFIENMNYYLEEVENLRGLEVLDDWKE